jgi:hypothetical protein
MRALNLPSSQTFYDHFDSAHAQSFDPLSKQWLTQLFPQPTAQPCKTHQVLEAFYQFRFWLSVSHILFV